MKLSLKLDLDNGAFDQDRMGELKTVINDLLKRLEVYGIPNCEAGPWETVLNAYDTNGNKVGKLKLIEK